jgi:hypothetical protein
MKFFTVKDYTGLWEAEYRTAGMKTSDNESVVGISSRRKDNQGNWVRNNLELDDQMIAMGLPDKLGYRFSEAQLVAMAASKNLTVIKRYELDSPIEMAHSDSAYNFITGFVLVAQTGDAVIDDDEETVTLTVPYGTTVTALEPVITLSEGATVDPESEEATDFTSPVTYTVTAENGVDEKEYVVTVVVAEPSTAALILTFVLAEQTGAAVINNTAGTIAIEVENGTTVTALEPTITLSANATVSPVSGAATNFTSPVTYTVTAEDGVTEKEYVVTVTVAA